jgi:hypothetical protein
VTEETARLLREANFTEVEVGLQSVEPDAMVLMDRKNNLRAFERGVRAMLAQGIRVKVDLIVGLPGDTVASVRKGLRYLHDNGLCSDLQVFNLAVLPGTAFREQAAELGLVYQPRPPYYALKSANLDRTDLFGLLQEAQDLFDIEFDPQPPPLLDLPAGDPVRLWQVDLSAGGGPTGPRAEKRALAFTLWLRSAHFGQHGRQAADLIRQVLEANPFTTLQVVLEPTGELTPGEIQREIGPRLLGELLAAGLENPTYLDKFYSLQPGSPNGAKRVVVVLPLALRGRLSWEWVEAVGETATLAWRAGGEEVPAEEELGPREHAWAAPALSGGSSLRDPPEE